MAPTCEFCASKPRTQTGDYVGPTCGASECQEAHYHLTMKKQRRKPRKLPPIVAILFCLVGCAEASWWVPPTITPISEENMSAWMVQVRNAIASWESVLPSGCVFPTQISDGGMPVTLLPDDAWIAEGLGAAVSGHYYKDRELVYVRGVTSIDCVGLVAHELGHVVGFARHSADPTSVMYYVGNGAIRPTVNDGALLASMLGCR